MKVAAVVVVVAPAVVAVVMEMMFLFSCNPFNIFSMSFINVHISDTDVGCKNLFPRSNADHFTVLTKLFLLSGTRTFFKTSPVLH